MNDENLVIETHNLTKQYGKFTAVDKLDLQIRRGEVYGLLGPNGSGKTTTILMILGLTEPTSGSVRVLGYDPERNPLSVKARVGYLPDQIGFYDNLTARENLIYIAKLNGLSRIEAYSRIDEALERMGLADVSNKHVGAFSRGMRQRLGVADLLIKRPQIIIMDEPTLGLDPEAARLFLNIIRELGDSGITILLSSHLLYQVQEVCDRVGLFHRGHKMLEGTVDDLAQRVLGGAFRIKLQTNGDHAQSIEEALRSLPDITSLRQGDNHWFVLEATSDVRSAAANAVMRAGGDLKRLDIEIPSLDEIYAQYFEEVEHAQIA
ncbi:MAG: ABC transporter ATP-binding protein [Anaerolineae bacterium]|nr:ABC transporter ATP-binding protein [Anaerolineae bacterium]